MVGLIMSWTEKVHIKWTSKKCFTDGLIRSTKENLRYDPCSHRWKGTINIIVVGEVDGKTRV